MSEGSSRGLKLRVLLVAFVYVGLFSVMGLRDYQLQIQRGAALSERAERQFTRKIKLPPVRGKIFDRNGEELATNREVVSVYAQPPKVDDIDRVAADLAGLLGEGRENLRKKLLSRSPFVWLKRSLPVEAGERIEALAIKGVGTVRESRRYYPNMELAGHLIGFAGVDSQGLEGVELKYDDFIRGTPGFFLVERDALGNNIYPRGLNVKGSTSGNDVFLTIDKTIQHIAERELGSAVEKNSAKGGMAVVMDPRTGEVLAMAVRPSFNPNLFEKSSPAAWRNRVVTDTFEPGSTFKIFLAAGALDSGKISERDIFFCENGRIRVYDRFIHDTKRHGWLSVASILRVSSNIGAYKIADKIGKDVFYHYILGFGFGGRSGIDLPGEAPGSVRPADRISPVGFANMSFGQGISVTAVQLVSAISAVANGGYLMKPYVVRKIVNSRGETVFANFPTRLRRVVSEDTSRRLTRILEQVISGEGTGLRAALDGYRVAGKTGTSQKFDRETRSYSRERYISSFIGYLPSDDPKLAILVLLDEPKEHYYGGRVAAPVFRKIAEQSLGYLKVAPERRKKDRPVGTRMAKAAVTKEAAGKRHAIRGPVATMPDLRGLTLREVLVMMGLPPLSVEGRGVVSEQSPPPGKPFDGKRGYRVKLEDAPAAAGDMTL